MHVRVATADLSRSTFEHKGNKFVNEVCVVLYVYFIKLRWPFYNLKSYWIRNSSKNCNDQSKQTLTRPGFYY